ncbi:MAG: glycoside hydrolase family 88 protein, partial [Planctomycetota bacterium]|nr:glycoside hydrolase family 88 protein [Planctomycetota bacterium]
MSCTIDSSLAVADIASLVLKRGCTVLPTQQHYTGILLLEAAVHRAECDPALREEARALLLPFARGERDFGSNFPNYQCGGNAAARALAAGWLDEARDAVTHYADAYLNDFPRDDEGLMMMPRHDRPKIWIDAAWAVAPFACFAGVALERPELIDDAVHQIMRMMEIFDDPSCDLIHQSRGFVGPNELSSDHWSRGNGWAARRNRSVRRRDRCRSPGSSRA